MLQHGWKKIDANKVVEKVEQLLPDQILAHSFTAEELERNTDRLMEAVKQAAEEATPRHRVHKIYSRPGFTKEMKVQRKEVKRLKRELTKIRRRNREDAVRQEDRSGDEEQTQGNQDTTDPPEDMAMDSDQNSDLEEDITTCCPTLTQDRIKKREWRDALKQ